MALENRFFQHIKPRSEGLLSIRDHIKVGKLPLEIDLLLEIKENTADKLREIGLEPLKQIMKISGRRKFIVEYKSEGDKFEYKHLLKIEAYRYHYLYKYRKEVNINQLDTVFIITQRAKFLDSLKLYEFAPGIYQIEFERRLNLIIINELEIIPENYQLLLFSSGDTRSSFLEKILVDNDYLNREEFINYASVYYTEELYKMAESTGVELDQQTMRNIKKYIEVVGKDKIIEIIAKDLDEEKKRKLKEIFED